MKWFSAVLPFLVASPLLILSAIWQGKETERWGEIPEMKQFAARLEKLPLQIGPWKGKRAPGLDESMRKAAGAEGDVEIVYTNAETNEQVDMFIVVGRLVDIQNTDPIAAILPRAINRSATKAVLQKVKTEANSNTEFRTAVYSKEGQGNTRIYWTWASDGVWKGPDGETACARNSGARSRFTRCTCAIRCANPMRKPAKDRAST